MSSEVSINYNEITYRLSEEMAIVTFVKKDGSNRVMLCTRNMRLIERYTDNPGYALASLSGHDKRCTVQNNTVAVIDLVIEEARSFNIKNIIDIKWLGAIGDKAEFDSIVQLTREMTNKWKEISELDTIHQAAEIRKLINEQRGM